MAEQRTTSQNAHAISDAIARLHVRFYGKGPSEAKTYVRDGFVFCVLTNPFTVAEQTLIEDGRRLDVRSLRQRFQDAMTVNFSHAVEEITGRKVVGFMSQTHVGPDLAIEIFKLAEPGEEEAADSANLGVAQLAKDD